MYNVTIYFYFKYMFVFNFIFIKEYLAELHPGFHKSINKIFLFYI